MVTLRSTRYPGLIIADLGVRFVGGVLESEDAQVVARARRLGALGVVVDDDSPEVPARRKPGRPRKQSK